MPRSPSPDRRSERSYRSSSHRDSHREDPRRDERRRSRSPRRHHEQDDRRSSRRDDDRRRSRSRERDSERRRRDDRDRSRSRERSHRSSRRGRSRSRSVSSSGSDSDDSRDRRHRSSRRRRSRSRSRDRGRDDKDDRRRRREEKKERKARREQKKRAKKGLKTVEWGKHGILTEADIYAKPDEFHAWLIGEKMQNVELLSKAKEKDFFKEFMEDYNTGTLPHEKYYDMKKYETKMNAVRMGETLDNDDTYDFRKDMEAAASSYRRANTSNAAPTLNLKELEELRKVQAERVHKEKMQRLGMDVSDNLGVRQEQGYRK